MEKNNKQLLIRDICARLPYGVYVKFKQYNEPLYLSIKDRLSIYNGGELINNLQYLFLRPMSSMTEEEREELFQIWKLDKENGSESVTKLLKEIFYKAINENYILKLATSFENWIDVMTWFNKKHFDYRGLIPMGLAIEAPEGMYVIK